MRGEVISVGTEILLGQIVDTNAALVGELYAELGIDHLHRQTVGDNLARIVEALHLTCSRSDIVVTIGGLGPTQDDLTRRALADATSDELILDDEVRRGLKQIFEERGISWTPTQEAQALRPSRANVIQNTNGTAP
ncbi:MAG: competence/damage-inducible protein A, partial [Chthonomonas sp.]|nr:competence/damage-inducible protein A [Chthonomonas sp.]